MVPGTVDVALSPCCCLAGHYRNGQVHWYCKYWWGAELTEAGYTVLFLDNDAVVVGEPFQGMNPDRCDMLIYLSVAGSCDCIE